MPSGQVLGKLSPPEVEAWGRRVGAAMAGLGLNCNLAPVLDLAGSGLMHATGRSLGTEPLEVAERSAAFSRGLWAEGIIPIGKHFPGYGEVARNTDYQRVVVDRTAAEFDRHLRPFAHASGALGGVMLANLGFSFYGGQPAIFSEALVSLAHEQGFITMTDDLVAPPLSSFVGGRRREVARAAFRAGNDLLLVSGPDDVLDELSEVLREELARPEGRALAREAAGRILRLKVRAGLLPALPPATVQRAVGSWGVERPCRVPAVP
jgi:beta-N-acetylhexosaminidase